MHPYWALTFLDAKQIVSFPSLSCKLYILLNFKLTEQLYICSTGDKCRPCECNENIDTEDPFACDDITGRCLNCLNSTYGDACERCAPGFYGDAITLKNCESKCL